jgi:hypothetical protein
LIPKYLTAHSTIRTTFEWLMTTPFGLPVEPDVNSICAASPPYRVASTGSPEKLH